MEGGERIMDLDQYLEKMITNTKIIWIHKLVINVVISPNYLPIFSNNLSPKAIFLQLSQIYYKYDLKWTLFCPYMYISVPEGESLASLRSDSRLTYCTRTVHVRTEQCSFLTLFCMEGGFPPFILPPTTSANICDQWEKIEHYVRTPLPMLLGQQVGLEHWSGGYGGASPLTYHYQWPFPMLVTRAVVQ